MGVRSHVRATSVFSLHYYSDKVCVPLTLVEEQEASEVQPALVFIIAAAESASSSIVTLRIRHKRATNYAVSAPSSVTLTSCASTSAPRSFDIDELPDDRIDVALR